MASGSLSTCTLIPPVIDFSVESNLGELFLYPVPGRPSTSLSGHLSHFPRIPASSTPRLLSLSLHNTSWHLRSRSLQGTELTAQDLFSEFQTHGIKCYSEFPLTLKMQMSHIELIIFHQNPSDVFLSVTHQTYQKSVSSLPATDSIQANESWEVGSSKVSECSHFTPPPALWLPSSAVTCRGEYLLHQLPASSLPLFNPDSTRPPSVRVNNTTGDMPCCYFKWYPFLYLWRSQSPVWLQSPVWWPCVYIWPVSHNLCP